MFEVAYTDSRLEAGHFVLRFFAGFLRRPSQNQFKSNADESV